MSAQILDKVREYKPPMSYLRRVIVELPELIYKRWMKLKAEDGYPDQGFDVWITAKTRDVYLGVHEGESIQEATKGLLEMWVQNFANNLPFIREKGKSIRDLVSKEIEENPEKAQGAGIVVGRGPQMFANKQLEMLAASKFNGKIIATDGALIDCLKRKIVPDYVLTVDGSPIIDKWYNDPLVNEYGSQIKAILSGTVHPNVVSRIEKAGIEPHFFIPIFDDFRSAQGFTQIESMATKCARYPEGLVLVAAGGNAGTTCWILGSNVLRLSPLALIGIEFGYRPEDEIESTYYWPKVLMGFEAIDKTLEAYTKMYNPEFDCWVVQDPIMRHYHASFMELVTKTPPWIQTLVCSPGSLYEYREPKSFSCKPFEQFLRENSL